MRVSLVFDRDEDGYRLGEFLDSDVQPVFLAYRDRDGANVFIISGEWTPDELVDGLNSRADE